MIKLLKILTLLLITNVTSQFIKTQVVCPLSPTARENLNKVELISIDSYPNTKLYYHKFINSTIHPTEGIDEKYCLPHSDNTMVGALGINSLGIPTFVGMKVHYVTALLCTGAGYEPYLISAIHKAIEIAEKNSKLGKITVSIYSIGGTYNTAEKIQAMKKLTEIPNSYVMTVIGNNDNQYNNCRSNFLESIPKLVIVGGTNAGNKLLGISMIGDCVNYYAPGKYMSPVQNKVINGVSFSAPIVGYLWILHILNNIQHNRQQIMAHLESLTATIDGKTKLGNVVKMKVFRDDVCNAYTDNLFMFNFLGTNKIKWKTIVDNSICFKMSAINKKAGVKLQLLFKNKGSKIFKTDINLGTNIQRDLYVNKINNNTVAIVVDDKLTKLKISGNIVSIGFKGNNIYSHNIFNC